MFEFFHTGILIQRLDDYTWLYLKHIFFGTFTPKRQLISWLVKGDKHTRWPDGILKGSAFTCYAITQLQADKAYKADKSELINRRVPGAALHTRRCLRQGHNIEVISPNSNSKKPDTAFKWVSRAWVQRACSSLLCVCVLKISNLEGSKL